ncbi:inosine monophosphate dehydrogenase [Pleurotus eryngii]|uniref:Inosine monophosphate dehydrogenase n=1 Tax=Pleurotus eryngii TaxID=5323 RepID=A0A9P6DHT8_PLEER|nr:inosine monophosphate dehydrogenase [Pleurotus eryngii]
MEPISTPFTEKLNIPSPIVLTPMAFGAHPSMAAIVSGAGGFGFVPVGLDTVDQIRQNLRDARKALAVPDEAPIPVGIGFVGWVLDITEASDTPLIPAALAEKPKAILFAFGPDLGKHIATVRKHDAQRSDRLQTLIFVTVNSVEAALTAANEWKVDVIVAQGIEAGGHGGSFAPPLFSLVPAILSALPPDHPPVLGSGGVSTGAQVAALLALGAAGAVVGTRFLFTPESVYTDEMKAELVKADFGSTTRGIMFDEVMDKMGWPPHHDGRAIINDIVHDSLKGVSLEERQRLFAEATEKKETNRAIMWAGIGVGMTKEIKPTKDVLLELHSDAVKVLKGIPKLLKQ